MASRKKSNKFSVPKFTGKGKTICIVIAHWHKNITDKLLNGAVKTLSASGISNKQVIIHAVPGSYEIPLGAQWMLKKYNPDTVICLGCIIKGETPHFDFIAHAVSNGIMQLNLSHNIPVILGVLTTNTVKQAKARSGGKHGNKGEEAAIAALQMMELRQKTTVDF